MAEGGPEAVRVSEVAGRARVNRTTAYRHFRSREALLGAVQQRLVESLYALLESDAPVGERIARMVGFFYEHPDLARVWLYELLAGGGTRPAHPAWKRFVGAIEQLAKSGRSRPGVDAEMLARILVAAPLLGPLWAGENTRAEAERLALELQRILLYGALPPRRWPGLAAHVQRQLTAPPDGGPETQEKESHHEADLFA